MIPLRDDNPSRTKPIVSIAVIVLCVLVFLWQLSLGQQGLQEKIYQLGLIPAALFGEARLPAHKELVPPLATVFTSMFLHGGVFHLVGNMLFLWIFGDNIEDAMGHVRFVVFYLVCGIAAALAQAIPSPESTVPMIGASGAISGVLGGYLLLYPKARVLVLVPIGFILQMVRLPAVVVLGLWFVIQLVSSMGQQGGVAYGAHLGGFLAGMALIPLFKYRRVPLLRGL